MPDGMMPSWCSQGDDRTGCAGRCSFHPRGRMRLRGYASWLRGWDDQASSPGPYGREAQVFLPSEPMQGLARLIDGAADKKRRRRGWGFRHFRSIVVAPSSFPPSQIPGGNGAPRPAERGFSCPPTAPWRTGTARPARWARESAGRCPANPVLESGRQAQGRARPQEGRYRQMRGPPVYVEARPDVVALAKQLQAEGISLRKISDHAGEVYPQANRWDGA